MAESTRSTQQKRKQNQRDSATDENATTQTVLPSEIIERIVSFLPLAEVCKCMLVCKQWKELLSSETFCKDYVLSHYDFEDEEEPSGHLADWTSPDGWFHYWEENADKSNIYVFSDPPKRWKCGIVHLADYTLGSDKELKYKDLLKAVYILTRIQTAAEELKLDCHAWANETSGDVETCLFPWSKDSLPTPEDIITLFHFNPEMPPEVDEEVLELGVDDWGNVDWNTLTSLCKDTKKANTFFHWLTPIFTPTIRYCFGCDAMNNVPCFILAKLAPGWVGGVLTALALT